MTVGDVFGTRKFLSNNYLSWMTGAVLGIYCNSREEALDPVYHVDADGKKLDGSRSSYRLLFGDDRRWLSFVLSPASPPWLGGCCA